MAKDYSDFILFICDAGERVYHLVHIRNTPEYQRLNESRAFVQDFHQYKYRVNMDRAYRIKWTPWKKVIRRLPYKVKVKPYWGFGTTYWYFGTKRGTVAKTPVTVMKVKKPLFSIKTYETIKEFIRTKKVGIIFYQEPCTHRCSMCEHKAETPCPVPTIVDPMHISRIHQPSGVMKG